MEKKIRIYGKPLLIKRVNGQFSWRLALFQGKATFSNHILQSAEDVVLESYEEANKDMKVMAKQLKIILPRRKR
jgi:hypothetical protein